ncbi:aminotransferase class III-fold pyridoxal phosphate-dependent enzyme [Streptomyces lydicus]|uniref:aminotransferase class III-fold pyridoxal phosphate-dependent enzyme n=1 Tax=Streptomyces lydicus TaxID=47763 RepID=UPI0036E1C44E
MDLVLPMNTGAEAVETAIKVPRKWGYERKGVTPDHATVIVADGNFHGRTTTIVSFSTDPATASVPSPPLVKVRRASCSWAAAISRGWLWPKLRAEYPARQSR